MLWPVAAGGVSLWAYRRELSYAHNFGGAEARAAEMERLAGGHAARLGYYPGDPLIHMLSGLPPVAGYLYMFPWVAEVAQAEVIADLAQGPAIVFLQTEASIWGRPVGQYLAPLQAFLEANYVQVGPNLYVSPDLYRSESDKRPGP